MSELIIRETGEMAQDTRGADEIAQSINRIKAEVQEAVIDGAIRIGRELHAAKSKVPYGEWGSWLKTHVDYSERAAQDLMRIADEYGRSVSDAMRSLSKTQAIALLGLSAEQREEFVATHDMDVMTTDQLKAQVKELQQRLAGEQQTIEALMAERDALREESAFAPNAPEDSRVAELQEQLRAAEERAKEAEEEARAAEASAEVDAKAKEAAKTAQSKAEQELAQVRTQMAAFKQRAETAERQQALTASQLMEERGKPAQVIYAAPPEMEEELARLRAANARSSDVQMVGKLLEDLASTCKRLGVLLGKVKATDEETGKKVREAAVATARKAMEELEG